MDKEKNITYLNIFENRDIISIGNCNILDKFAWIEGIRVHPDYHNNGLAQRLIRLFELTSKKLNLCSIGFSTGTSNIAMNKIARKFNYKLKAVVNVHFLSLKTINYPKISDLLISNNEEIFHYFKEYQKENDFIPLSFFGLNLNDDIKDFLFSNYRFWKADNFIIVDEINHIENTSKDHHFSIFNDKSYSHNEKSTLLNKLILLTNKYKKNKLIVTSTENLDTINNMNKYFNVSRIFRLNYYQKDL
ncbi:MAG: hypothetical protein HeimC3_19110 [Candidatus Heimdallarchaeota archaeon LC_3]|nr:MAG: hypothetical protein HeimC3_19110 [Candidatus Heimdallarchaeota archaeon LC_3]